MRILKSLSLAAALMLSAVSANAVLTVYTDLAAFQAATTGLVVKTEGFEGLVGSGDFAYYPTLDLDGVTFTSNGQIFVIGQNYYSNAYTNGSYLTSDFAATNLLTATLDSPATAIALDFGGLFADAPVQFTFNFSDGSSYVASTALNAFTQPSLAFIGFTSSVSITSVQLAMPDSPQYNAIDNFRFGAAQVPEPASLALVGLALVGMASVRRRR